MTCSHSWFLTNRGCTVSEDKCHYPLSVMWSGFQLPRIVCVLEENSGLCNFIIFAVLASISISFSNIFNSNIWVNSSVAKMRTCCEQANHCLKGYHGTGSSRFYFTSREIHSKPQGYSSYFQAATYTVCFAELFFSHQNKHWSQLRYPYSWC